MSIAIDDIRYRPLAWGLVILAAVYGSLGVASVVRTPVVGILFAPGYTVTRVFPGSPAEAAGFRPGDKLQSVDGRPLAEYGLLGPPPTRPDEARRYVVEREGVLLELSATPAPPPSRFAYMRLGPTLVSAVFICIGFYVYIRRTSQLSAVFFLFCLAMGWGLLSPPRPDHPLARFLATSLETFAWFASASLLAYLFLVFPRPKSLIRRHPGVVKWLFALSGAVPAVLVVDHAAVLFGGIHMSDTLWVCLESIAGFFWIALLLLAIAMFFHGYATTPAGPQKRHLRLVLAGTLVGILPVAVYSLHMSIDPYSVLPLEQHVVLLTGLVPLSLGYAISMHPSGHDGNAADETS